MQLAQNNKFLFYDIQKSSCCFWIYSDRTVEDTNRSKVFELEVFLINEKTGYTASFVFLLHR